MIETRQVKLRVRLETAESVAARTAALDRTLEQVLREEGI